jgi:preprotein translocase subunit SecG
MITLVLVIHLLLAIALVSVVLLQKSEGGGLGMGGGMSGFMTGRSTANLLTRTTAIIATCFFATSITLAILAGGSRAPSSILDQAPAPSSPATPAVPTQPAAPSSKPAPPAEPASPSVPLAK